MLCVGGAMLACGAVRCWGRCGVLGTVVLRGGSRMRLSGRGEVVSSRGREKERPTLGSGVVKGHLLVQRCVLTIQAMRWLMQRPSPRGRAGGDPCGLHVRWLADETQRVAICRVDGGGRVGLVVLVLQF